MRTTTRLLLATCSLAAIAMPAAAQTAPEPETSQEATSLGDVIVTAQRREQRILDVPVSVNVVSSEQLDRQNITTLADLSRAVPALNGAGGALSVRGVATTGVSRSSEAAVSVVVDGVVMGRAAIANLFDIQRVEVLSGPQGMLFGKNASAGVVNITTVAPDPTAFEVIGHIDYGENSYERERLTLNVPITSTAAVRVGLHNDRQDTLLRNSLTGARNYTESYGGRARVLWEPTDALSINLSGDWEYSGNGGVLNAAFSRVGPGTPLVGRLAACGIVASSANTLNCSEAVSRQALESTRFGYAGQVDYRFANGFTVSSITAQRNLEIGDFGLKGPGGDSDFLNLDILSTNISSTDYSSFTQEFKLVSPAGERLEYVAGLFYSDSDSRDQVVQAGTLGLLPPPLKTGRVIRVGYTQESYAAYGQATYHLTDEFSLIGGARYTDETLDADVESAGAAELAANYGFLYVPGFSNAISAIDESVQTKNWSWRLGAQYDWSDTLMTYLSVARGYKGAAVNDQGAPSGLSAVIRPEIPLNVEAGLKGTFLDGRVLATVSAFHTKVDDFQTPVYQPPTASNPVAGFFQGNAPNIVTKGVDVSLYTRPMEGLSLNVGVIYNDASYSSDFVVACNQRQTPGAGSCSAAGTTAPTAQLANTPKWRGLVNGEYARPIGRGWEGFVQADLTYQSAFDHSSTPDEFTRTRDSYLLGGRIGVRTEDGRYGLSLYGRNLLDNTYPYTVADAVSVFNGGARQSYYAAPSIDWRRNIGLSLDARF